MAFFAHDGAGGRAEPPGVRKWLDHEQALLAAVHLAPVVVEARAPGSTWVVWRLLSGNNREIGRGVGAYGSLAAAQAAARAAVGAAGEIEVALAYSRDLAHGWCLRADRQPLVISPTWHRSRRTNRLSLEIARQTLPRAELNHTATNLSSSPRAFRPAATAR